jgi:hypothetical protein
MSVGRPFKSGNPGRPKGSRNKLGEAFLDALHADWQEHGTEAIARGCQEPLTAGAVRPQIGHCARDMGRMTLPVRTRSRHAFGLLGRNGETNPQRVPCAFLDRRVGSFRLIRRLYRRPSASFFRMEVAIVSAWFARFGLSAEISVGWPSGPFFVTELASVSA